MTTSAPEDDPCDRDAPLRRACALLAHLQPNAPASVRLLAQAAGVPCHHAHDLCRLMARAGLLYQKPKLGVALIGPADSIDLRAVAEAVSLSDEPRGRTVFCYDTFRGRLEATLELARLARLARLEQVTLDYLLAGRVRGVGQGQTRCDEGQQQQRAA